MLTGIDSEIRAIFQRPPRSWNAHEIKTLQQAISRGETEYLRTGPRQLDSSAELSDLLEKRAKYHPILTDRGLRRYATAWSQRDSVGTLEENTTEVQTIFGRNPEAWTLADVQRLQLLLSDIDPTLQPEGPRKLRGHATLTRTLVGLTGDIKEYRAEVSIKHYIRAWEAVKPISEYINGKRELDLQLIDTAKRYPDVVNFVVSDDPDAATLERLVELVTHTDRSATLVLNRMKDSIPAHVHPDHQSLKDETIVLIDRNLLRIAGRTPNGAVVGYRNYPDYSEIGTVQANIALLNDLATVSPTW